MEARISYSNSIKNSTAHQFKGRGSVVGYFFMNSLTIMDLQFTNGNQVEKLRLVYPERSEKLSFSQLFG